MAAQTHNWWLYWVPMVYSYLELSLWSWKSCITLWNDPPVYSLGVKWRLHIYMYISVCGHVWIHSFVWVIMSMCFYVYILVYAYVYLCVYNPSPKFLRNHSGSFSKSLFRIYSGIYDLLNFSADQLNPLCPQVEGRWSCFCPFPHWYNHWRIKAWSLEGRVSCYFYRQSCELGWFI